MENQDLDPRSHAILTLQQIRGRYQPGSYAFDVADHAIDLALSPRRAADKYLVKNSLRDARKILSRQRRSAPIFVSLDALIESVGGKDAEGDELTLHDICASLCPPPDQFCAVNDYTDVLYRRVSDSKPAGVALECMLRGDSSADFARKTGLSASYFKKLKSVIQHQAISIEVLALN